MTTLTKEMKKEEIFLVTEDVFFPSPFFYARLCREPKYAQSVCIAIRFRKRAQVTSCYIRRPENIFPLLKKYKR